VTIVMLLPLPTQKLQFPVWSISTALGTAAEAGWRLDWTYS
jgi:hypothetical protein